MPIKSSEDVFNESIEKLQKNSEKAAERTRKIKELRTQMNEAVVKSTFARNDSEKERYASHAQSLKRQIDFLRKD